MKISSNHLAKINYSPIITQQHPKFHKSSKVMQPLEREKNSLEKKKKKIIKCEKNNFVNKSSNVHSKKQMLAQSYYIFQLDL
jgi:hypothetical protein